MQNDLLVIRSEIKRLQDDVERALKILVNSNGSSLVSRTAVIENKIDNLDEAMDKLSDYASQLRIALIVATLSFAGSVVLLFVELGLKK